MSFFLLRILPSFPDLHFRAKPLTSHPSEGHRRKLPGRGMLTQQQERTVRLVSLGCSIQQTAAILGLSSRTVDNHATEARAKLGVRNIAQLTRAAIRLEISPLDDTLSKNELAILAALA